MPINTTQLEKRIVSRLARVSPWSRTVDELANELGSSCVRVKTALDRLLARGEIVSQQPFQTIYFLPQKVNSSSPSTVYDMNGGQGQ